MVTLKIKNQKKDTQTDTGNNSTTGQYVFIPAVFNNQFAPQCGKDTVQAVKGCILFLSALKLLNDRR